MSVSGKRIRLRLLALALVMLTVITVSVHSPRATTPVEHWSDEPWAVAGLGLQLLALGVLVVTYLGARRDMRHAAQQVENLRESEWFATSTVDALSAQIAILDSSGSILSTNQAWRFAEASVESVIARIGTGTNYLAVCDSQAGRGHDSAGEIARAIRAVTTGQCGQACVEYSGEIAGETRWFVCRVTKFPGNAKVRIVMAHEDITARKRAEELAEEAKRIADAASQSKTAFLANMSHEIRTPMTAILGYGDLMLDPNQSAQDRTRCVQVIRRNGEHLLRLINDVLDISKIEANKYEVERVRTDLRQMLSDIVALTRVKAIQKGLNFKVIVDGPVPKEILTDPLRLKQILVNIIGNAIKFTSTGGVYLRVSCQDRVVGSTLHVDVIDTGIGLSPDQMDKLFRPFSQADESTTRQYGGTGLGLVISRRFAQLLGGDIAVQSQHHADTCFSVWVDAGSLGGVRMLPSLDEADLLPASNAPKLHASNFDGRVLLAEDGEDNQQLFSHMLRNAGVDVVLAPNGVIAVELAMSQQFDLVLMDMQMPELDGYGAARKLRESGYARPIVALTANAMADDRAKCLAAGCDDYLSKPLRVEYLTAVLKRYLRATESDNPEAEDSTERTPEAMPDEFVLRSGLASNEKYKGVLEKFVSRLPDRINEIERLLCEQDMQLLGRAVHQIKGAAGGYGFPQITTAAAQAEEAIKQADDLEQIAGQVRQLVSLVQRVDGFPDSSIKLAGAHKVAPAAAAPSKEAAPASSKSRVDQISGLSNRTSLAESLSADVSASRRSKAFLHCIAVKVDQIDAIQTLHGPASADQLIKRLAVLLEQHCQGYGTVYRADHEHFIIVVPNLDPLAVERLLESLGGAICAERYGDLIKDWKLACVFGLSQMGIATLSAEEMINNAMKMIAGHRPETKRTSSIISNESNG